MADSDQRTISQNPSSSGGEGGLFGNASAAIGDVGLGNSSAELGDTITNLADRFSFAGPTINKTDYMKLAIALGGVLVVYGVLKKLKVFK
jgi:hypothetical protein